MLPTVIQDPSFLWSISVALASDVGDRPAATTTSVPVGCCNRGSAHSSTTARTATRTAAIHKIRGRVSALRDHWGPRAGRRGRRPITRSDAVDVGGAHVGPLRAPDLNPV